MSRVPRPAPSNRRPASTPRKIRGRAEGYPKDIAVVSRGISIRVPGTSQGGGGRGPAAGWPGGGGGGGGRGGDDNMPSYGERLRRYRLGLILALSSVVDRKSTRLNSSHLGISYAV